MNFSICLITRNESKTLPRLLESLTEYRNRGGEICIVDTGSSDNTAQIARDAGCIVEEVGDRYRHTITKELADQINERFIVDGEEPVVKEGETYFDFASARNHVASLAKNDMISFADADECFTSLNIDAIDDYIKRGYTQFEYNFVFAHDQYGNEAVKFVQSKFYDRRIIKWVGIIHEMLSGPATHIFLDESILKLEHWQNQETNRSGYLRGLAVDCFNNPENDRNSHYFAREMYWCGRPKSAIKEFERHIEMNRWHAEKAQSMIFIGDIYGQLGNTEKQIEMYSRAYLTDSGRREALLNLARVYQRLNNYQGAAAYAKASLEIPWNSYYANNMSHYTSDPHEILYWAKGWLGDIEGAQYHILEALRYQPENPIYLRDTQYYFDYKYPGIEGWMTFEELIWLHSTAKEMDTILELGSWKGRSTHALATACKGKVTCVDTWKGSEDINDLTNYLGKAEDVFETFKRNTRDLLNIIPIRKTGNEAALDFADNSFDMVFIDAGHRYEDVIEDIHAWLPKAKKVICGHDYQTGWPGVMQAVNEVFGRPDGVCDTIWYKFIDTPKKKVDIEELTNKIRNGVNFSFVKRGDGELACMQGAIGENCDGHPYSEELANNLKEAFDFLEDQENTIIVEFENQEEYNSILHREDSDLTKVREFYKSIIYANKKVVFVGPTRLKEFMESAFNAQVIEIPEINAYSQFEKLKSIIPVIKDAIYLFSAGMTAKCLIAHLLEKESSITCIDCGSAFDPAISQTRTLQISQEKFIELYLDEVRLPTVSIIIPQLGRISGLIRCLQSIENLKYPKELIEVRIIDGPGTVPVKVKTGVEQTTGEYIVYASNDIEFDKMSIFNAVKEKAGLVAFNTGMILPDEGNICEHFMIQRSILPQIGGEIFDTEFNHVGCDNLLWAKCKKLGVAVRSNKAVVKHYHFSTGAPIDSIYERAYSKVEEDRALLTIKLAQLN